MKTRNSPKQAGTILVAAWMNIFLQTALPLTAAMSPLFARADTSDHLLPQGHDSQINNTRPYTLQGSDTVQSVAEHYNISPDELRKLNQFRTFAQGFDHLRAGDELDVPLSPVTGKQTGKPAGTDADDKQLQQMAGMASRTGSLLSTTHDSDAVASLARGAVTSDVSQAATQWLNTFGSARVQLDTDNHFSLKNSQFDFLLPLADTPDDLFFMQSSLHRTDDRTQTNLGSGIRWFAKDYMLGGNTFLDYDLSRDHARMGLGMEYWRDYLRLGANDYLRLTNWKDSPDRENYEERPADGWDIRAEGYLPVYPQLGGKLMYEQYYGDNVALFGKDNLQKNPHAVTVGLSYTPVPLVTFTADEREGKGGQNDTRIGLQFQWKPGMSWAQQLSSDEVSSLRRLDGSRYDFVARNNDIVLDYKKKEDIVLKTAASVSGYVTETKSLGVSIKSSNGVQGVDWSAPELFADGGSIVPAGGNNYNVVIPSNPAVKGKQYTITGVAIDRKGHRSSPGNTLLRVNAPEINTNNSTFSSLATPLEPGSSGKLTLVLKDNQQNIIDEPASNVTVTTTSTPLAQASLASAQPSVVSPVTRTGAGTYSVTITAGTTSETLTLTPVVEGTPLDMHATVRIGSPLPAEAASVALESGDNDALANDIATNSVKATVTDADGKPVAGQVVNFSAGNGAKIAPTGTTQTDGSVTMTLTSTKAGLSTVAAEVNGSTNRTAVTFIADSTTAQIAAGALTTESDNAPDDGTTINSVKATVTDANGNPVPGQVVNFTADNDARIAPTGTTQADGAVTMTLTSNTAGTSTVKAEVNGSSQTTGLTFTHEVHTLAFASVTTAGTSVDVTAGFPETGFNDAHFTLNLPPSFSADDYHWGSNKSEVTVSDAGEVTLNASTPDAVTVTATPKSGGDTYSYTFTIKHWFIYGEKYGTTLNGATTFCTGEGYTMPATALLTNGTLGGTGHEGQVGKVGTLFGEWGNMSTGYSWPGDVWSDEGNDVDLYEGWYSQFGTDGISAAVCVKNP